ncbi:MAG: hypothetical protein Q4G67_14415 [Actinomycetia bacterium]|nr:hypothetical protein [Actinomycetes bacterium]
MDRNYAAPQRSPAANGAEEVAGQAGAEGAEEVAGQAGADVGADARADGLAAVGGEAPVESPGRGGAARVLLFVFVLSIAAQVFALYLYVPGPETQVDIPHADKIVHAALFAAPAFVAVLARLPLGIVVPLLALHAPVSELVQHAFISGRAGEPLDVVADLVGVLLGVLGGLAARR